MAVLVEQLVEQSTRHQVYLERLKTGEVNQFASFLQQIDRSVRARLSGEDLTDFNRARLNTLLASVNSDLRGIYSEYWDELAGHLIDLSEYEAGFEARSLDKVLPSGVNTVVPPPNQIWAAVTTTPLSVRGPDGGKLLESFVKDWSTVETKRVTGAIRQGYFEGQTTPQIIRNIRGTKVNGFRDGILNVTNRNASSVVRTAVQHTSSASRQRTWESNKDIIDGVRWVSTLDSRTSAQCRSLDGQVFALDKGPRPPIHINCRSTTVSELSEKFKFLEEGATRKTRGPDGVDSVDADQTYYSWLKKQPAAFQNDAIGPARAKLLRDGGLTSERFSELNLGRNFQPLTLQEMARLEPVAFEKAGI